jgi:alpha,alpha-trehalase
MSGNFTIEAVVFDLDGVVTKTALVHAHAWKKTFDDYLKMREKRDGEPFKEFTHDGDYLPYVDGKPRYQGVKSFLESRNIGIPFGDPSDAPDKETACGIGNKKNEVFTNVVKEDGVQVYGSSVDLIRAAKKAGIKVGVASSSKNCKLILESAGIEELFETRVDGVVSAEMGLEGKPEGDIFVTAARNMKCRPEKSVVIEDATSGVMAGRNGGFGLVLGVARKENEYDLLKNGADLVVDDLSKIDLRTMEDWFHRKPQDLFKFWDKIENGYEERINEELKGGVIGLNPYYIRSGKKAIFRERELIFFLDYDGTLSPIVERPELAVMPDDTRELVRKLSQNHTVAVVSGRQREDVQNFVKIDGIFYAGSHGFDIVGPNMKMVQPQAEAAIPVIDELIDHFKKELKGLEGVLVEEKKFSVAVHYRLAKDKNFPKIEETVRDAVKGREKIKLMSGKKVFEILPDIHWNKGEAIRWIIKALKLSWENASVIYIGDDTTDEDAFRMLRTRGTGILVSEKVRESTADFYVKSTEEVKRLFEKIIKTPQR